MNTICPVCSTFDKTKHLCSCGGEMIDSGPVTDYFGPYSPYYNVGFEAGQCIHLFTCPNCGNDERIAISLEVL